MTRTEVEDVIRKVTGLEGTDLLPVFMKKRDVARTGFIGIRKLYANDTSLDLCQTDSGMQVLTESLIREILRSAGDDSAGAQTKPSC